MAAPFGIDRFLNIRAATAPSFSPDGRFLAFLTNITGVAQVWQVPVEGGWPVQLTFGTDSVRGVYYNPMRHILIYAMDAGGNERTQLYLLRGVGGNTDHGLGDGWVSEDLTRQPKAIHTFGGWSNDGEQFAFSCNREEASRFDIHVQKLGAKESTLLAKGPGGYYTALAWSPDDRHLLVSRNESNINQDLYIIEVATGKIRHLTPHKGDRQYHHVCWTKDGKQIWCATTADGRVYQSETKVEGRDLLGLAMIDLESAKVQYVPSKSKHEVEEVAVSKAHYVSVVNVDGRSELGIGGLLEKLPSQGVVSHVEFSRDELALAWVFEGPRYNPDIWITNPNSPDRKLRQVTFSSRAGVPFSQFVEPDLIRYKTFDDRMIPAWFYPPATPPEKDRLPPVIVYPHGGPESQTRPAFNAIFQYFCQAGYAILAPNVRGSSGYGTAYMNLDNTTKRMDSVADLAHAAYWLRDQKKVDAKRMAVYGGSYGGFMVLAQVTHYPDLWAAGIDVVGICNFVTFMEKTGAYRRAHREAEYGNLREHREFFEKISPINHVDKIKCPMLVIHGANDPRVPVEEAEQIVAALKKRMIPVEYLRYEDEGHGLARLKNRLDAYPKMVAFLDRYLK
jgi:dipeptidyl aminopeptidase/acylaminoacyl peptidase